ncbi:MAG: hypothetical protein ACOC8P_00545 [Dichotomicrobium sp.]
MTRLQKIVERFKERLAEIRTENGYRTDAGKRTVLVDTEADPQRAYEGETFDAGLVIQIQPGEPLDESGNVALGGQAAAKFSREITIFGFRKLANRADWFGPGQELEADIKQALFGELSDRRYYRDTGLEQIRMGTAAARVPGYGDEFLGVEVALEIVYVENLSNPWEPDD